MAITTAAKKRAIPMCLPCKSEDGSSLEHDGTSSPVLLEKAMLSKAIKLVAALGFIAAIGSATADAGPCSCSRGAGGTLYCTCR